MASTRRKAKGSRRDSEAARRLAELDRVLADIQRITEEIESGRLPPDERARAYRERGGAHQAAYSGLVCALEQGRANRRQAQAALAGTLRDNAIADFGQSLALDPENAEVLDLRASLLSDRAEAAFDAGGFGAAVADCERAFADLEAMLRLEGRDSMTLDAMTEIVFRAGQAHAAMGDHRRAVASYDAAIAINPGFWSYNGGDIHGSRGDAHHALGDPDRAVRDWVEAFRLDWAGEALRWQDRFAPNSLAAGALKHGKMIRELRQGLIAHAMGLSR